MKLRQPPFLLSLSCLAAFGFGPMVHTQEGSTKVRGTPFVPLLSTEQAWKTLPALEKGAPGPLPQWALATAKALPRTTAAVLELEHRHRAQSPLDPVLSGQIRLIVAHANRCAYGAAQARADLIRAGLANRTSQGLLEENAKLPPVLDLARKLTLAAFTVTDAEVVAASNSLGEKRLVAVVQLVAFANFQDRLLLSLGIVEEPNGPLVPRVYEFAKDARAMDRPPMPTAPSKTESGRADPEWRKFSFADLKQNMETQKTRPARIRVPTWDEVKTLLPPEAQKRELKIKWSLVCSGYQPELAQGWSACTRAFNTESELDRVFEESLFWVVTRTLQCFY